MPDRSSLKSPERVKAGDIEKVKRVFHEHIERLKAELARDEEEFGIQADDAPSPVNARD